MGQDGSTALFNYWCFFRGIREMPPFEMHKAHYRDEDES